METTGTVAVEDIIPAANLSIKIFTPSGDPIDALPDMMKYVSTFLPGDKTKRAPNN